MKGQILKQTMLSLLSATAIGVYSQTQPATFSATDFSIVENESKVLEIYANNNVEINGYQITVTLPEELEFESIATDSDCQYGELVDSRKEATHRLMSANSPKNNSLTFAAYSTDNSPFRLSEGAIMQIKVKAKSGITAGDYPIKFSDIEFSDKECTPIRPADFTISASLIKQPKTVTLNKPSLTLSLGQKATLTATVTPDDEADKTIAWSSSDESVATVSAEGEVHAVGLGTASITATSGEASASCSVTIATLAGDANGDGEVDDQDLMLIVNYLIGITSDKFQFAGADYNGDGEVDDQDLMKIVNALIGAN